MDSADAQKNLLTELEDAVFSKRPILGETYRKYSTVSLFDFTKEQLALTKQDTVPDARKNEVIEVIQNQIAAVLGSSVAADVALQLKSQYSVITADHHGPLTDPGFLNNNLLTTFAQKDMGFPYILVLSCANVSFDNDSFPRGHFFHSVAGTDTITNQLVFFPRKVRPLTVANYHSYQADAIVEAKKRIMGWIQEGVLTEKRARALEEILQEIYAREDVLAFASFSDQVTKTNYLLWEKATKNIADAPHLIYLQQEQIVNQLLTQFHLHTDTIVHKLLFDDSYGPLIEKYFNGISGGFTLEHHSGTYLFWGLPKDQKYRVQLWKDGNSLRTLDGSYQVELTPSAITQAIAEKELIPSTLLSFITLSFYHGITLIGGGGQTSYFTKMKHAYQQLLTEAQEEEMIRDIPTNRQAVPYQSIAFLTSDTEKLIPATTLDLLLYGTADSISLLQEMSKKLSVKQAFARALVGIYKSQFRSEEGNGLLQDASLDAVDSVTGFLSLITPFARIGNEEDR